MNPLVVSGSSHEHAYLNVNRIMWYVVVALMPAFLISIYFFGLSALIVTAVSVAACMFFEWSIQKYLLKGPATVHNGSAVITGILLAFNLPSNIPLWIVLIGAFVAIGIAKMAFGGLGKNIFNPALVGRAFLLISFPGAMGTWPTPHPIFGAKTIDALTGPTILDTIKTGLKQGIPMDELMTKVGNYTDMLIGNMGGSFGEVSALALIVGAIFLIERRIITWHIPVAFLGSAFAFSGILWLVNPALYINPLIHLLTGGMMLGALFMATDMTTSPMSKTGMLIFGCGCGLLTILIRVFGAYPEGVSFAILIMNALTPLINMGFKQRKFGH